MRSETRRARLRCKSLHGGTRQSRTAGEIQTAPQQKENQRSGFQIDGKSDASNLGATYCSTLSRRRARSRDDDILASAFDQISERLSIRRNSGKKRRCSSI